MACVYCEKLMTHRISEHLQHCHIEESEVAKAYGYPPGRKGNMALALLKNKWNLKYNVKILAEGAFSPKTECTQHTRQPPLVILALQDCIPFGQRTGNGEFIVENNLTNLPACRILS